MCAAIWSGPTWRPNWARWVPPTPSQIASSVKSSPIARARSCSDIPYSGRGVSHRNM